MQMLTSRGAHLFALRRRMAASCFERGWGCGGGGERIAHQRGGGVGRWECASTPALVDRASHVRHLICARKWARNGTRGGAARGERRVGHGGEGRKRARARDCARPARPVRQDSPGFDEGQCPPASRPPDGRHHGGRRRTTEARGGLGGGRSCEEGAGAGA